MGKTAEQRWLGLCHAPSENGEGEAYKSQEETLRGSKRNVGGPGTPRIEGRNRKANREVALY